MVPSVLPHVMVSAEPPPGAARQDGVFSVVVDDPGRRVRDLPSLYLGRGRLFADRDVTTVVDQLPRAIAAVQASFERPTYLLTPFKLGGRLGLYGRDPFNRSTFRLQLQRLGATFAPDPYVVLTGENRFHSAEWGELAPDLVVVMANDPDETKVLHADKAMLAFLLAMHRLGNIDGDELGLLARTCTSLRGLGAQDPLVLVDAIRALP